jgi:hypothetical protein
MRGVRKLAGMNSNNRLERHYPVSLLSDPAQMDLHDLVGQVAQHSPFHDLGRALMAGIEAALRDHTIKQALVSDET